MRHHHSARPGRARLAVAVALSMTIGGGAAAQETDTERYARIAREAAERTGTIVLPPAQSTAPSVSLTLDEALRLAVEKNLDIAVERLNPQAFDFSIAALRASYLPTLSSTFGRNDSVQLPTSQLIGGQRVTNDISTYNGGVAQNLPWAGGNFTINWNNRRQESSSSFNTFNPQFNSSLTTVFTQPLLRGRSTDAVRNQLFVARINREISEVQLRGTITNTLADVRNAYWDLVYAVQALEVARQSLALADKLVEDNKTRVEIGTMAQIDVVEAEAEAATRRQSLTLAEATWRTSELALKRLIVDGTDDPVWTATLDPTDRPAYGAELVDVVAAVQRALSERTDLVEARRELDATDSNLRFFRNSSLPSADLVASYGLQGIGGTSFVRSGGLGSPILETIPGGYQDALNALTRRDFPSWNLQLQMSYPIGTSAAEANHARARVQRNQSLAEIRALELQVATDVTNAALQVESNLKRVEAATAARALVQRRLEAEQSKFEVGMSTNFFVVQAQRDLSDAQNVELRALLDYRKSLVEYERVQQASRAGGSQASAAGGGGGGQGGGGGGGS